MQYSSGSDVAARYAEMMARFLGPVVMAGIEDDDVTEVYVNPSDHAVRFDTRSRGRVDSGARISPPSAIQFLNAVATFSGVDLTPENPSLQAELPRDRFRGSRLQGFIPPVTPGPAFVIRKPATLVYSLDQYVADGILSAEYREILRQAVLDHWNVLVVGGTGTGKTTLLNAILLEIAALYPRERIVVLEDTVELQCTATDHLPLRKPDGASLADLVKSTLRTSPNRIVVGEMRDQAALDWLDASSTGHPGSLATLHATNPEGALLRLDRLAQRAGVPSQRALIAEAVDLIALLQGGNAGRRVTDLVHVTGLTDDGRYILHRLGDGANQGGWV